MPSFKIRLDSAELHQLSPYSFKSEGSDPISPQALIEKHPQVILSAAEIDLPGDGTFICAREFNTSRGLIDLLFVSATADVIVVETKLLRNPESQRTVVAQVIDYAKALYSYGIKDFISQLEKNAVVDKHLLSSFRKDDNWTATLDRNVNTGNFAIIIVGDKIHPNVLGMVESIQAAPHMAFTVYLMELDPYVDGDESIVISPKVVAKTVEVERSVIRIEIDHTSKTHKVDSELPDAKGKGSKPFVSAEQYLSSISKPEFQSPIRKFWSKWQEMTGDIRFGTVGFSAGIKFGEKRVPLFYLYNNRIARISDTTRDNYSIPNEIYEAYKDELKKYPDIYDRYIIGNKVDIPFEDIDAETLNGLFDAAIEVALQLRPK